MRGGVGPHLGYPVAHFGNPAQQGQADVIHVPCTDAGGTPLRMPYLMWCLQNLTQQQLTPKQGTFPPYGAPSSPLQGLKAYSFQGTPL